MKPLTFSLRRCGTGDKHKLALVGGASFLEAYADVLDGEDIVAHCRKHHSPEAYAHYLAQPAARLYTAEITPNHAAVGYIVCCDPDLPVSDPGPGDYELKRIYLLHRFQGLGIGRALMDQAIAAAAEIGRTRLLLGVYGQNHEALRFYRKAGFEQVGERFFTVGSQTHHDAVMARDVRAS